MSCTLYWRPVSTGRSVGDSRLRDALREEFGPYPIRLDDTAIPFLRGLRAARMEGVPWLIEMIEKHGEIELYTEC